MKSSLFYKYFFSYLFIFSIPAVILGVMIYQNAVVNLRQEIETSNLTKLSQVKDIMDMQYKSLENTAIKISFNPALTPFMVKTGGYVTKEAIQELGEYKGNNPIVDDIFLYFRGDQAIYSSDGSSSLTTLTTQIYRFEDGERFIDEINRLNVPTIEPVKAYDINRYTDASIISYRFPILPNNPLPYGSVLFFINEQKIRDLIGNILGDLSGAVYILDRNRNVIISSSQETTPDILPRVEQLDDGISKIRFEGRQYSTAKTVSELTGWSFLTVMPNEQFFHRVVEARSLLLTILVLLLITGLFTSVVLSRRYARPIRELVRSVKAYWQIPNLTEQQQGELNLIRATIDEVYKSQRNLQEKIDIQRPIVRNQWLMKLLKGHAADRDEALSEGPAEIGGAYFFVIYLSLDGCYPPDRRGGMQEKICGELTGSTIEGATVYALEHNYDSDIVIIVGMDENGAEIGGRQQVFFSRLAQIFRDAYEIEPGIGIGNIYDDVRKINRSFIEASAAVDYRLKLGQNKPIYFKNIHSFENRTEWFPIEDQLRFVQSMKQGDRTVAIETLDKILDSISAREQSSLIIKCMCFDVINAVLRTYNELETGDKLTNVNQLVQFRTMVDLRNNLSEIIDKTCDTVNQRKESNNTELSEAIVAYIHQNYNDNSISLEQIAGLFHLSVSYLSRFLKEQTGYTFLEVVTHLRMEEIRRELKHSDRPIKDIIQNAGYYNIQSFNRKFKSLEGVSPGEYRKLYAGTSHP